MIYFIADMHFFHKNILRYDLRPYRSVEEMNKDMIRCWNERIKNEDTVYILGDLGFYSEELVEIIKQLNGHKILIKGNHDDTRKRDFVNCFDRIYDYKEININGKKVVLCHYPMPCFNNHFYGAYHLYAHVHNSHEWHYIESFKKDMEALDIPCNMINVGAMMPWIGYTPRTFEEIVEGYDEWRTSENEKIEVK